ncbi:3-isopropylmalate dehydratase small subunit [Oscillibacter sp. MSJ-2]|uniref:3-isopropylmalate dehydratase small subunit n=1 Tax=Dysosmobacter acutus TaxID=2841504 RepID=A0ABS6FDH8_9FIRM|nr:3-isopropylmalate dehydratase small subunit [Dysosmobacter acutus]MBU5628115.1 3-isopropylmalate dehydratase small subunit [Dysosmobacter acutus]
MSKALVYGDSINTDLIIAGKYTKTLDFNDLAAHCMEDLDPDFVRRVEQGDVLVAGGNFGCGSSREQAPIALKYAGVGAVLAKSFARIFYRNAINVGLPVLICDTSCIREGDLIRIDMDGGKVVVNGERELDCQALSPIMQRILQSGGLASYLKEKGDFVL